VLNLLNTTIRDLGTRWKWVVSFTPLLLYPWRNSLWYPLDRRLIRPQSLCCHYGEEKNLAPSRNQTPTIQPIACRCYGLIIPTLMKLIHRPQKTDNQMASLVNKEMCNILKPVMTETSIVWHSVCTLCRWSSQHFRLLRTTEDSRPASKLHSCGLNP
jgi:hypothetical protein